MGKDDFNNRAAPPPPVTWKAPDISPEELCRHKAHQCYVPISETLGIQAPDFIKFSEITDAHHAKGWSFGFYSELEKPIPEALHQGTVLAEALLGYPAIYSANKSLVESSFRATAGNPRYAYGWQQLQPDATLEGLYRLQTHPLAEEIRKVVPEIDMVTRTKDENDVFYYNATDPAELESLLETVRTDPIKSTLVAAAYNKHYIDAFEKDFPNTRMTTIHAYCVHFFGPRSAYTFMQALENTPDKVAYHLYDKGVRALEVKSNKNIFIDKETKAPRTFADIADFFENAKNFRSISLKRDGEWPSSEGVILYTGKDAQERMLETGGDDYKNRSVTLASPTQ